MDTETLRAMTPKLLEYLAERDLVPSAQQLGGRLMTIVVRLDEFEAALESECVEKIARTAALLVVTILWLLEQQGGSNWSLRSTTPMPSRYSGPAELTRPIRRMFAFAFRTWYAPPPVQHRVDVTIALEIALTSLWRVIDLLQLPVGAELDGMVGEASG